MKSYTNSLLQSLDLLLDLVDLVLGSLVLVGTGTDSDIGLNADDSVLVGVLVHLSNETHDLVPGTLDGRTGRVQCALERTGTDTGLDQGNEVRDRGAGGANGHHADISEAEYRRHSGLCVFVFCNIEVKVGESSLSLCHIAN